MRYIIFSLLILSLQLYAKDYTKDPQVKIFIDRVSKEHNLSEECLGSLFCDVTFQKTPLKLYSDKKQDKKKKVGIKKKRVWHGSWDRYARHKLTSKRAQDGASFISEHKETFEKVEKEYGIPTEYIAAIIGIETIYGKHVGGFPVFDTLTTLAFEKNRRNEFFQKELEEFILLSLRMNMNPKDIVGSYAGAIGLGQFMPSSYTRYGVDFNKDGEIDMFDPEDVIASIANYLAQHGWESEEQVATRVSYKGKRFKKYKTGFATSYDRKELKGIRPKCGQWDYHDKVRLIKLSKRKYDELWYGTNNFYVITRYNNSSYYAMSIHKLALKIKDEVKNNAIVLASNESNLQ